GSRLADRLGVADSSIRRSDALSEAIDAGAGANLTVGLSAGLVDAAAAALSGVADCRKNQRRAKWRRSGALDYMAYQGFCPSDTRAS
uniref:2-phosphosulfolactate phosphatase n=1 Tax=Macrostomum lignano TaxID=282301 RepID=A0A1I8F8Z8_9PLAT